MQAIDGLKDWAKERPRNAVSAGGGLVLLVVLLFVIVASGDVDPTVSGEVAPPVAGNTPAADGTVAAQPGGQAATQPGAGGAGSKGVNTIGPAANETEVSSARSTETSMNSGLPSAPSPLVEAGDAPVPTTRSTPDDVAFAGRKLELVADELTACLATAGSDIFACLRVVPKGFTTVRVYEARPQGVELRLDGTTVGLRVRGEQRCRTLSNPRDCNAWSVLGD